MAAPAQARPAGGPRLWEQTEGYFPVVLRRVHLETAETAEEDQAAATVLGLKSSEQEWPAEL